MSKRVRDAVKFIAMVLLPALGALYFALAEIWGLPAAEQVVGSIVAVDAFLGLVLHITPPTYDGSIDVVETKTKKSMTLNVPGDPYDIDSRKDVRLKVNKSS